MKHRLPLALLLALATPAFAADAPADLGPVSRIEGVFDAPSSPRPEGGGSRAVSAPLMGNGDVGVCLTGKPEALSFWVAKNDFWLFKGKGVCVPLNIGILRLSAPALAGAAYATRQSPAGGMTTTTLTGQSSKVTLTSFVAASANVCVFTLACEGEPVRLSAAFVPTQSGYETPQAEQVEHGRHFLTRAVDKGVAVPAQATVAWQLDGTDAPSFTLVPGKPVTLRLAVASNFDPGVGTATKAKAAALLATGDAPALAKAHAAWWRNFWSKSFVEIPDADIMRRYYLSQYGMACASRNPKFPPAIIGPWITASFGWCGYWMNYNHAAPFYGLYSSNHLAQADPQDAPILDFMPTGEKYAKDIFGGKMRGVIYSVGIGPFGLDACGMGSPEQTDRRFEHGYTTWGQRSNAAYDEVLAQKAELEQKITSLQNGLEQEIAQWQAKGGAAKAVPTDGLVLRLRLDENHPDDTAPPTGFVNSAPGADKAPFATTGPKPLWGEDTHLWPTFRLGSNTVANLGQIGDFDTHQAFSAGGWFKPKRASFKNNGTSPTGALLAKMDGAAPNRGWNLLFEQGVAMVQLISAWPGDALSVSTTVGVLPRGEWTHVFFTYDGSGSAAGIKIYVNGSEQPVKVNTDALKGTLHTEAPLYLGRRHPAAAILQEAGFQDVRVYGRALPAEEALRLPYEDEAAAILKSKPEASAWSGDERHILSRFYFSRVDQTLADLKAQAAKLDAKLAALGKNGPVCLVCREADTLPYADILHRGGYSARVGRVAPDTPHFLPPMGKGEPRNRLGLADWVIAPENPLTARVAVNRMWQEVFGTGIVETAEDFGVVGERPANQALLDWLAVDFREHGWAVKRMYKMMLMSAAYRQRAQAKPEAYDRDDKNHLLARGPRFRMDAEMIRDSALQASGLLVEKLGGPSVRPYQPPGVWEAGGQQGGSDSTNYTQEHGEALYRRSLYTVWKRLAIMPDMEAFDAPDRQLSCVRRPRTNTPMAALVLFNNVQLLEAARFLGLRAIKEGGASDDKKLDFLARTTLSRGLEPEEAAALKQSLAEFRKTFAAKPDDAAQLLKQGEKPKAADLPDADQATWMMVAHQFFNLDAFLNK